MGEMVVEQMGTWEVEEVWRGRWADCEAGRPGTGCGSRLHCPLSKKFLWEELELVREEVTFIYQKLRECLEPGGCGGVGRGGGVLCCRPP